MQTHDTHVQTPPAKRERTVRRTTKITAVAFGAATIAVLITGVIFTVRGFFDPQWNLSITHLMESGSTQRGISNPVEVTGEVCAQVRCVEAFDTSEALYVRFANREHATQYAERSADAFQSNYIVMDFSSKASAEPERQRLAMGFLVSTWQDFEGTLPTRG